MLDRDATSLLQLWLSPCCPYHIHTLTSSSATPPWAPQESQEVLFSGEQRPELFLRVFLQHSLLEVDATVSFWHTLGRECCSHLPLSFRRCLWGTCCYWLDLQREKNTQGDFLTPHSVGGEMSWILWFRLYTFTTYPPQAAATTSICPMAFKCSPNGQQHARSLWISTMWASWEGALLGCLSTF